MTATGNKGGGEPAALRLRCVRRKMAAGRHLAGFSLHPFPASFRPFRSPAARQKTFLLLCFALGTIYGRCDQLRLSQIGQLLASHFAHTQLRPIREYDRAFPVAIPVDFTNAVEVDNG